MRKSAEERAEIRRMNEANRLLDKDRTGHLASRNTKVGRGALMGLSQKELTRDEFETSIKMMRKESDRASAVMGAALAEDGLTEVLAAFMKNGRDRKALFEDIGAPFGTFKSKTVAAHALGLLDDNIKEQLDVIRWVRNQFSHALLAISFETPQIAAACAKLGKYSLIGIADCPVDNPETNRFKYEANCTGIWLNLNERCIAEHEKKTKEFMRLIRMSKNPNP